MSVFYRSSRVPDGIHLRDGVKHRGRVYLTKPSGGSGCTRVRTCPDPDLVCLEGGCAWCSPCRRECEHRGAHDFTRRA